jgi:DNA-binding MarR family transcriptional regulator
MDVLDQEKAINDFLGSAHLFASAVSRMLEGRIWSEIAGKASSQTQLRLLKLLSLAGSYTMTDVATFLDVSRAAASKSVDKLVKHMLIRRCEGDQDRREVRLSLTGHGRRIVEAYDRLVQHRLMEIFGACDPGELRKAEELLDQLSAAIIEPLNARPDACAQCGMYFREHCRLREDTGRRCLYRYPGQSHYLHPTSAESQHRPSTAGQMEIRRLSRSTDRGAENKG